MKIPMWAKAVIGLVLFAVALVAADYVAGFMFLVINKTNPLGTNLETFYQYWYYYHADPLQSKHLKVAATIAVIACFVAPVIAILQLSAEGPRSLHGDARFATAREVRKSGLMSELGIIVGKFGGRFLIFAGQQFVILAAATRGGKGVGFVIPNLLNWRDSVVNFDPKQENYEKTAGFRKKHGQEVHLFNPFAEDWRTSRYNPLAYISDDPNFRVGDVLSIGTILYPAGDSKDAFWNDQARNLFLGLTLYLCETPELPRTIGEVYRQSSGKGKPVKDHLSDIIAERDESDRPLSEVCVDALMRFISTSENTLANIVASFNAPLIHWSNPIVDAATSANDFDLRELRKKRMSIYVGITPDYLDQASLLVNLFFSQLINLNTKELPEKNPALRYQCLLLMDEFTSIGRIAIIAKAIAYMAGYGLRLATVIQSIGQLESTYPKEARNLITNHALQILFTPREKNDANEYSEMLGYLTDRTPNKSRSGPRGFFGKGNLTESQNDAQNKRALLLPQELREMSLDKEIVMLENVKPIMADKIKWYADDVLKVRQLPAPEVPLLDLDLHRAKVERRTREVTAADVQGGIDLSRLAHDFSDLPEVDNPDNPSAESVSALVGDFFARLEQGQPAEETVDVGGALEALAVGSIEAVALAPKTGALPAVNTSQGPVVPDEWGVLDIPAQSSDTSAGGTVTPDDWDVLDTPKNAASAAGGEGLRVAQPEEAAKPQEPSIAAAKPAPEVATAPKPPKPSAPSIDLSVLDI
ncbi:type IV secretory system conjugative DNA transfer family protein [Paraburkholderia aspalathi]|uniref:type IV secretory system conjugative DNA transfer family protein n=1 Tax=Paraburkholderia aspalathi TaxID=1324617 RepID=UPI001F4313B7|nr:type IV secretory system conjugative DNA transfer family protein [Paraburkholderia aspalathi]